MDRRVTPPKRVTSPTWGTPPPCKQVLRLSSHILGSFSWRNERLSGMVWTPIRYVTLHFKDRRGARAAATVFMCDQKLYRYGFRGGAKAIQYNVNTALVSWSLISDGLVSLVSPRQEVDGGWVSNKNKQTNKSRFAHISFSIVLRNRI